jgi:hypothetical protein
MAHAVIGLIEMEKFVDALVAAGMQPHHLQMVSESPVTACRVVLSMMEMHACDNLDASIFETETPVNLTSWTAWVCAKQGCAYLVIFDNRGNEALRDGEWCVELLVDRPLFEEGRENAPGEPVMRLNITNQCDKDEFDRILKQHHPDITVNAEEPAQYQAPCVTVLRLTKT